MVGGLSVMSRNILLYFLYAAIVVSTWMICKRLDRLIELCTFEEVEEIQIMIDPQELSVL